MLSPERSNVNKQAQDSKELALLANVRLGDRNAFADLYCLYHRRLFAFVEQFTHDSATTEEVVDDVMLVVWKDCRKFRGKSRLSTWIFGIAYRKALKAVRAERRHQEPISRGADLADIPHIEDTYDNWITIALQRLSVEHRQVIQLTYYDGFSYKEIASITGCPVNTVKTRMFHARRLLKSLLQEFAEPSGDGS